MHTINFWVKCSSLEKGYIHWGPNYITDSHWLHLTWTECSYAVYYIFHISYPFLGSVIGIVALNTHKRSSKKWNRIAPKSTIPPYCYAAGSNFCLILIRITFINWLESQISILGQISFQRHSDTYQENYSPLLISHHNLFPTIQYVTTTKTHR